MPQQRISQLVCIHVRGLDCAAGSAGPSTPKTQGAQTGTASDSVPCFVSLRCSGDVPFYVTSPAAGLCAWGEYTSRPIRPHDFAPWARDSVMYTSVVMVGLWAHVSREWTLLWEQEVDLRTLVYANSVCCD